MKISVCITTYNEEENISKLLEALLLQSLRPNEIIIVDAGSKDKTKEIISNYKKKHKQIKLRIIKGVSRAVGRNIGIRIAKSGIIAMTDAGCIPDKDWLKNITKFLRGDDTGLVAGFYTMPFKTSLQEASRVYLGILPSKFDMRTFLPAARSVAFTKNVWKKVGGFNENLNGGAEDSEFFYKCVKNNVKIKRVKNARVEWSEIKTLNLFDIIKKFLIYSKGDGNAKIWWHPTKQLSSHNIKISLVFIRYLFLLGLFFFSISNPILYPFLFLLVILYLFWPIFKWRKEIKNLKSRLWLPILQIVSDLVSMYGFVIGTIETI